MTSSSWEKNLPVLMRRFDTIDEFNQAANEARLTPVGLVVPHVEVRAAPVGTPVDLDWRLADGAPLVTGRAEVVEITGPRATLRVLELDPICRVARLFAGEIGRPAAPPQTPPDQDDTVIGLVERTYRSQRPAAASGEVFLPPEPPAPPPSPPQRPTAAKTAPPPPAENVPTSAGREAVTSSTGRLERAVVVPERRGLKTAVALLVATGLGVGARFSFVYLEPLVTEMLSDAPAVDAGTLDVPPPGVQPSRLPPPAPSPEPRPADTADAAPLAAAPVPAPPTRPLDRLRSIRWDREGDTTVVTLWGNGSAHAERLLHTRLDAPQPRELLKVRGVDLPFRESALLVGTPELQRIRVGFHPKPVANELHIVLDLPDHQVALTGIEAEGQTYRLVLTRRR